jgi:hypothetical protein
MPETRTFRMHPKLLYDVILRQAGSLAKAILEGGMNSVDAKARRCEISLTDTELTVCDDGHGITRPEHVEKFFETFGQPHDEHEQKVYGTFRMGRGQLFAYGRNVWRTGPFEMHVDIKRDGLDYRLFRRKQSVEGCRIAVALYDPLLPSELAETERVVRRWLRYAPIEVSWNGEPITVDPASEKWDHVTPEAWIRLKESGSLALYNLGVHTMDVPNYRFGIGGEIVSRKQLKVNFARNDVQSGCRVWRKIQPLVNRSATDRNLKKTSLDDAARQRLADQIVRGELTDCNTVRRLRLLTAVNGRQFSNDQLCDCEYRGRYSSCPRGHRLGDKLFQQKVAFIFADETLERFGVGAAEELVALLGGKAPESAGLSRLRFVPFAELSRGMNEDYDILDESELRPNERLWLRLVSKAKDRMCPARAGERDDWFAMAARRKVLVGTSGHADGWTDGRSYVALSRQFLGRQEFDVAGFAAVGRLLLHEFCHDAPDTAEHTHTHEFYELFHDSTRLLGDFVRECLAGLPRAVEQEGRKLSRKMLHQQDRETRARRSVQEFHRQVASAAGGRS